MPANPDGYSKTIRIQMDSIAFELMERARCYARLDRSTFIRQSIREKAKAVIAKHEKTEFTAEDWMAFFNMLDHPAEPTDRMRKAARKHRKIDWFYR